jgi:hypothetical protein
LQAICDADESLAQRFGSFYDAQKIYLDYDEMLSDDAVDAVIIAVSDAFHVPAAMKALSTGKHVLCEKPLGTNVYEVEELARRLPNVPSTACWAWSFYILERRYECFRGSQGLALLSGHDFSRVAQGLKQC